MKNKKASTPLAVTLLVFLTLSIIVFSIYTFSKRDTPTKQQIISFKILEEVYALEEQINFLADNNLKGVVAFFNEKETPAKKGYQNIETSIEDGNIIVKKTYYSGPEQPEITIIYKFKPKTK